MKKILREVLLFLLLFILFLGMLFVVANWPAIKDKLSYWFGSERFSQVEIDGLGQQTELLPPDDRLVIPKLAVNVPLLIPESADEPTILEALQNGVAQYPGTALPGERGNVFITGHSSQLAWESGRYKNVFALLEQLEPEDTVLLYYQQKKYVYSVSGNQVVQADDTSVLAPTEEPTLTLMTCWPIGTTYKRLIVRATLAEPAQARQPQTEATPPAVLPKIR